MARRLNTKLAIIALLFIAMIGLGGVVYYIKSHRDPQEYLSQAEAKMSEIDKCIAEFQDKGDFSDEAKESVGLLYKEANEFYGSAFGLSKDTDQKIEILFTIADLHLIDNPYHQPSWKKAMGIWNKIVTIDTSNVEALKNQIDYYRQQQESISVLIPGGNMSAWSDIEKQASDLADAMKSNGQEADKDILKLKGWAIIEIVDSGQVADPEETLKEAINHFEGMLEKDASDIEVYEYLARAYMVQGRLKEETIRGSLDQARQKKQEIIERALTDADDKAKAAILLVEMKFADVGNDKEKLELLRPEYEDLAAKYSSNHEVYYSLAKYYSVVDSQNVEDSIKAIEKAMSLDPDNLLYFITASRLYIADFSSKGNVNSLDTAINITRKALEHSDTRDVPGPKQAASNIYRNIIYDILANSYVEQAVYAKENDQKSLGNSAIDNAEKMVYEIKQLAKADDFLFSKWDGLLAYIKGDMATATRDLYKAHQLKKATGDVDPKVSYYLSKALEEKNEVGARLTFLSDALINKNSKPGYISIASSKPEALLDYAELLFRVRQIANAKSTVDVYNERYSSNQRSKKILILCDIYSGSFDDAADKISKLTPDSFDTIDLEYQLVSRRILTMKYQLNSAENSQDPKAADDNIVNAKKELDGLIAKREKLTLKLLGTKSDNEVQFPFAVYDDFRKDGKITNAAGILDAYLARNPDDVQAKVYKRLLLESDPANVSAERINEIRFEVYNSIKDNYERNIHLASISLQAGKNEQAIEYYRKAYEAAPEDESAINGWFEAALKADNLDQAREVVSIAAKNNLDDCNGDYYSARLDIASESYQSALEKLDKCLDVRPIFPYAYLAKSRVYMLMEKYDEAVDSALKAASLNYIDGTIARQVAIVINERNQRLGRDVTESQENEMKQALLRAVALNPGDWKLESLYAKYISKDEPVNAIAVQQNLFRRVPNEENAILLANMAFQQHQKVINKEQKRRLLEIAKPAYEAAYKMAPDDENVLITYSEFLRVTGQRQEAVKLLEGNDKLMANLHLRDGQFEKAKEILEKLYSADKKDVQVISSLMLASQKLSNKEDLKKYSEQLIAVDPSQDNQLQQIQMYLDAGIVHDAELKLESFRTRFPDESRALLLEAWLSMSTGKLDKALELVSKNLADDPENPVAWRLRGQIQSLNGDYEEAIDDLVKSRSLDDNPTIQIELANAYNRAGMPEKAISVLAVALEDDRAPVRIREMLETLYYQEKRNQQLANLYKETLYKYPQSVLWHFKAGRFALQDGRYTEAIAYFQKAWKLDEANGGNLALLDGYLTALRMDRKLAEAIYFAEKYTETEHAPVAYLNIAKASHELGRREKALEFFMKAIEKSGDNNAFVIKILQEMADLLGPEATVKWCSDALEKDPKSVIANLMMYRLSLQKAEFEKALSYIDVCLSQDDPDGTPYIEHLALKGSSLLQLYLKTSDKQYLDSSIKVYESMLEKRPNNADVMNNLAYLLADNGLDLDKAVEYAKRANKMVPDDANKMDTYAYVLCRKGEYQKALELLQSALSLYSKDPNAEIAWDFYEHLGIANEGLGDNDSALLYYRKAIETAKDNNISSEKKQNLIEAVKRLSS